MNRKHKRRDRPPHANTAPVSSAPRSTTPPPPTECDRPPVAATCARTMISGNSSAPFPRHAAAPEDGRTPDDFHPPRRLRPARIAAIHRFQPRNPSASTMNARIEAAKLETRLQSTNTNFPEFFVLSFHGLLTTSPR